MASNPVSLIPAGLSLRRAGAGLEDITTKAAVFRLLSSNSDLEILEGRIAQGERLSLVPLENPPYAATEVYYILSGQLCSELPGQTLTMGPGDFLLAEGLQDVALFSALTEVHFLYICSLPTFHQTSQALSELKNLAVRVETTDDYTAHHCDRIQRLAYATGKELGLSHHQLYLLDYGAYLHDVGKTKIPPTVLQKPAPLTQEEWPLFHQHPITGRQMLETTFMKASGPIVEQHHERLDGSGYPFGLGRDEVMVESYIVAVADSYDAMTSNRPYRQARSHQEATDEILRLSGTHFPAEVVKAFFSGLKRLSLHSDARQPLL
jgi:HD-GYP domain-containing protein (c-di-GMP phosphodiesterase class II)